MLMHEVWQNFAPNQNARTDCLPSVMRLFFQHSSNHLHHVASRSMMLSCRLVQILMGKRTSPNDNMSRQFQASIGERHDLPRLAFVADLRAGSICSRHFRKRRLQCRTLLESIAINTEQMSFSRTFSDGTSLTSAIVRLWLKQRKQPSPMIT